MIAPDIFGGGPTLIYTFEDLRDTLLIGTYKIPRGSRVTLNREKIYSITKVGKKGSIKEFSGYDDWKITIEGTYVGPDSLLARKELRELYYEFEKEKPIRVTNNKLIALNITHIVLTRIELPSEDRDFELPFRIEAISDDDIELDKPDLLDLL